MAIIGLKFEWNFVYSVNKCDVQYCEGEVVVIERWSGRSLCSKHAKEEGTPLENARENLILIENHNCDEEIPERGES